MKRNARVAGATVGSDGRALLILNPLHIAASRLSLWPDRSLWKPAHSTRRWCWWSTTR
ncbi:MAG: hypothetical protein U1F34_02155 [Gammaproteobacteria bacterium]